MKAPFVALIVTAGLTVGSVEAAPPVRHEPQHGWIHPQPAAGGQFQQGNREQPPQPTRIVIRQFVLPPVYFRRPVVTSGGPIFIGPNISGSPYMINPIGQGYRPRVYYPRYSWGY